MKTLISLCFLFCLSITLFLSIYYNNDNEPILVYAGKGMKIPVEACKDKYEKQYPNSQIKIIYAGSKTLSSLIKDGEIPDIFIPGTRHSLLEVNNTVVDDFFLAYHTPVLLFQSSLKNKISSLSDCAKEDVIFAIGNPLSVALGATSMDCIRSLKNSDSIIKNIKTKTTTVMELISLIKKQEIHATIIWNDLISKKQCDENSLSKIAFSDNSINKKNKIFCALLNDCDSGKSFFDFMKKEASLIFNSHGFKVEKK